MSHVFAKSVFARTAYNYVQILTGVDEVNRVDERKLVMGDLFDNSVSYP
jgi:hypothetical protein